MANQNNPDIHISLTREELEILIQLVNRLQIEGLRNCYFDLSHKVMSPEAHKQWMKETVEEYDTLMTLKSKLRGN